MGPDLFILCCVAKRRTIDGSPYLGTVTAEQNVVDGSAIDRSHMNDFGTDAELAADFGALFTTADTGIARIETATRRFVAVNDALCRALGFDRATLLGMTTDDLLHPDDLATSQTLYAAVRTQGSAHGEARLIGSDGRELWMRVHGALVADADGVARRTINLLYDLTERQTAQRRFEAEAERSHAALTAAQAGTWEYRYNPPQMLWSAEVYALYDRDPALGPADEAEWAALLHPHDVEDARRLGGKADGIDNFAGEFRVRTASGGWRWLASRARVIRDASGARQRIVGINIDLTARKAAEAKQQASTARFRAAIDAVAGVMWTNDATGRMTGEQPGWAALTGQSFDEYQGFGWGNAIHPEDYPPTLAAWNIAVSERCPFVHEHRVRRADGVWRDFAVRAIPSLAADGSVLEWVGVHTDITDARTTERALRDLNVTLELRVAQAIVERDSAWTYSRDILLVVGRDDIVQAASPAWTQILGWPVADVVGRKILSFIVEQDIAMTNATREPNSHGAPFENRYRHADGSMRWIAWVWSTVDELVYASGRDVTDEKAQRVELERAQAQLQEIRQLENVGQLTGGVAHDFNNLLTPIIGSLDVLQRRGALDERGARLVAGALTAADRAKTLVQRLLAFARRQQLRTVPTDIAWLIAELHDRLLGTVGANIALTIEVGDDLPPALIDAAQLELALLNLALNARDAMPGGGRLTIVADAGVPDDCAQLAQRPHLRITVKDSGEGMDEATLRRAVEPFFTTRGVGRGTGLGLSMVHGFAAQSDGRLLLDSVPGVGTTATLWLPVAPGVVDRTDGDTESAADFTGRVALLVDDEPLVRATTAAMLAELGMTVVEADGGVQALAVLEAGTPVDILVSDYLMPVLNGAELIRAARSTRPNLPALLVTGYVNAEASRPPCPASPNPFASPNSPRRSPG